MKMGDVTDRMSSLPRNHRGVTARNDLAGSSSLGGGVDLKSVLKDVEPLPGSSMFNAKEVDEVMQSTAKIVGDTNVDWMIRLNAVSFGKMPKDCHLIALSFSLCLTPLILCFVPVEKVPELVCRSNTS